MISYDTLNRDARTVESLLDTKLTSYSRLASTIGREPEDLEGEGSSERVRDVEDEVGGLLEKLSETNDQLSVLLNDPNLAPSQSMARTIQRHSDVLEDYTREFKRTQANVQAALDKANLLNGVRNDISAYKSSATDSLLAERGGIDNSHRMMDDTLDQAYETRAEFGRQRASLAGVQTRMLGVINTMPGVNNLLSMIKTRRRRDSIIVGCVIGVCTLLLLSYISS